MRVTVLGSGAACPPAGDACAGYLVEDRGQRILLDCGHGVIAALQGHRPDVSPDQVDHLVISHMHPDHFVDLLPLRFRLSREIACGDQPCIAVHLPPGGLGILDAVLSAVEFPADFFDGVFELSEYDPCQPLSFNGGGATVEARFAPGRHYVPSYAVRVEGEGSVVYSGDTAPCESIVELAHESTLFICEATLQEPEPGPEFGHCTPTQAAEMAAAAAAEQLLLSHLWFDSDTEAVRREAAGCFSGELAVARGGLELELRPSA
jgi:ribonuclease BN (tRNA processing enzyme)